MCPQNGRGVAVNHASHVFLFDFLSNFAGNVTVDVFPFGRPYVPCVPAAYHFVVRWVSLTAHHSIMDSSALVAIYRSG